MRKRPPHTYFIIFFSLLALMSLPKDSSESLRGNAVAFLAPTWQRFIAFKSFFSNITHTSQNQEPNLAPEEIQRLRLENTLLHNEISQLKDAMKQELKLISQLSSTKESNIPKNAGALLKKRHRLELQRLLQLQLEAVPAKVIFRSPSSWNSSIWINVGNTTNTALGREVIAKNSPVVVGNSLVGVIDYVGKQQARVRLITDSGLSPSVRALRGSPQALLLSERINTLIQMIESTKHALSTSHENEDLITSLNKTKEHLYTHDHTFHLAKGELHGASKPLWRKNGHILKGIGFNYDFSDNEGPARDLRSGKPLDPNSKEPALPILKTHDLLVTTGMDGVFPPGLLVAEVTALHFLKEGDYTYEIDAVPVLGNLDELSLVFVIPPTGFDVSEQPPPLGW